MSIDATERVVATNASAASEATTPPRRHRHAKIVATLGPSSSSKDTIRALFDAGCLLIDCQVETEHLSRFGAADIPRRRFLQPSAARSTACPLVKGWAPAVPPPPGARR